jgi:hypothetical protein
MKSNNIAGHLTNTVPPLPGLPILIWAFALTTMFKIITLRKGVVSEGSLIFGHSICLIITTSPRQ